MRCRSEVSAAGAEARKVPEKATTVVRCSNWGESDGVYQMKKNIYDGWCNDDISISVDLSRIRSLDRVNLFIGWCSKCLRTKQS